MACAMNSTSSTESGAPSVALAIDLNPDGGPVSVPLEFCSWNQVGSLDLRCNTSPFTRSPFNQLVWSGDRDTFSSGREISVDARTSHPLLVSVRHSASKDTPSLLPIP